MANDDFSAVTASIGGPYQPGATMTVNVAGQNKHTSDDTTTHERGTASVTVQGDSGATTTITTAVADIVSTIPGAVTFEDVKIVSVTGPGTRVWTVSADGKSATAVA